MAERSRLDQLLTGLKRLGYEVTEADAEQAVIRNIEHDATYVLTGSESWVSAMQMLLEADELHGSEHATAVYRFALDLHGRYLGCRFGFDEDKSLCVQYDIYPDMTPEHVAQALIQLSYIAVTTVPLFQTVLAGGVVDDRLIDRAFASGPSGVEN